MKCIEFIALFLWDNAEQYMNARVEQDISLVRFAHSSTLEINFIFPHLHVLFYMYVVVPYTCICY